MPPSLKDFKAAPEVNLSEISIPALKAIAVAADFAIFNKTLPETTVILAVVAVAPAAGSAVTPATAGSAAADRQR